MSYFKGTQGVWLLNEKHNTIVDCNEYGIAQEHGVLNGEQWIYNALLISKAPELLDLLFEIEQCLSSESEIEFYKEKIRKLMKEATQL